MLSKDQEHGKAYGTLTWRGKEIAKIQKIGSTGKRQWKMVSLPDYKDFVPDISPPRPRRKERISVDANADTKGNVESVEDQELEKI